MKHINIDTIKELNNQFGFEFNQNVQDWEHEYSDKNRIVEFIDYFENSENINVKFALMSLILSSFDDLIAEEKIEQNVWKKIKNLLLSDYELFEDLINYWCLFNQSNSDLFSITFFMRNVSTEYQISKQIKLN